MSNAPTALLAFVAAAIGVGIAWLGFKTSVVLPIVLVAAAVGVCAALYRAGELRVRTDPVGALPLMAWRLGYGLLVAAGGSAAVISLGVALNAPEDASVQTEKLLAASLAALTTVITAWVIKDGETADASFVAKPVEKAFKKRFEGVFETDSVGQLAVFSSNFQGKDGWGPEARKARAEAIAAELKAKRGLKD